MEKYFQGNSLFFKYWYVPSYLSENKKAIHLPGGKNGISGSAIGGYNIAISKYSNSEKMKEIIQAYTYLTSKTIQRKVAKDYLFFSPVPSIYEEEELCSTIDCEFFKSAQLIARPIGITDDYNEYSSKFRNYVFEYIYGNRTSIDDVLRDIDDLTRIYYLTIDTDDSYAGLIIIIIYTVISFFILASIFFLYSKKFNFHFKFLPNDFWLIIIFGLISLVIYSYLEVYKVSTFKCHLDRHILSFSFYLIFVPFLYKLIVCFPVTNNFSIWISHHRYIFLFSFITMDELITSLLLINPYSKIKYTFSDGKMIELCQATSQIYHDIITALSSALKACILIAISILAFAEWNLLIIKNELQIMIIAIYLNFIFRITLLILSNISINNYVIYFVSREIIFIFNILVNFTFIYFFRIIKVLLFYNNDEELKIIQESLEFNKKNKNNVRLSISNSSKNNSSLDSIAGIYKRFINYHYKESISLNSNNDSISFNNNTNGMTNDIFSS